MPISQNAEALRVQYAHRIPDAKQQKLLREIRQQFLNLATFIDAAIPKSREQSLAQTKLDECRMWACNAATLGGEIKEQLTINHPAD